MLLKLLEETRDTLDHTVVSLTEHGDLGPAVEDLGVPVRALEMSRGRPGLGALRELRGAVRRSRPDIVHGWMYHAALATVFSGFGGPTVWGIHHSISDLREESRGIRAVLRVMTLLSFHCSRILYCAESSARQHEELGFPGDKRWVIPNGFDCDTFRPDQKLRKKTRAELGLNEEPFLVGHLARFHPMKGHETFFRAAGILLERIPDAVFVLAGRNVDKSNESLAEWIRREDLGPSVLLLGQRDDVPAIMNPMDIFTVSSAWGEAFPIVLGEAMACGVPCVATDVGDCARIVGDTGCIVPAGNAEALADAWLDLIQLGTNGRKRLGEKARRRVQDLFSLQAICRRYEAFYESLV